MIRRFFLLSSLILTTGVIVVTVDAVHRNSRVFFFFFGIFSVWSLFESPVIGLDIDFCVRQATTAAFFSVISLFCWKLHVSTTERAPRTGVTVHDKLSIEQASKRAECDHAIHLNTRRAFEHASECHKRHILFFSNIMESALTLFHLDVDIVAADLD